MLNKELVYFASIKLPIGTNSWVCRNLQEQVRKKKRNPPAALLEILSVNRACAKVIRSFLIQDIVLNGVFFKRSQACQNASCALVGSDEVIKKNSREF